MSEHCKTGEKDMTDFQYKNAIEMIYQMLKNEPKDKD